MRKSDKDPKVAKRNAKRGEKKQKREKASHLKMLKRKVLIRQAKSKKERMFTNHVNDLIGK